MPLIGQMKKFFKVLPTKTDQSSEDAFENSTNGDKGMKSKKRKQELSVEVFDTDVGMEDDCKQAVESVVITDDESDEE